MRVLIIAICSFLLFLDSGCSLWSAKSPNENSISKPITKPPFSTKEPETFQAKMVITASLGEKLPSPPPQEFVVARTGDKRRVDFEREDEKLALIQTPSGQFALNITKKEYLEIKPEAVKDSPSSDETNPLTQTGSPLEKMFSQTPAGASYEKMGQEEINGRLATKYKVTTRQIMNAGDQKEEASVESFIWVDESLGMPIKSETITTTQDARSVRYLMEVRDIKLEAPPASAFEIPSGFKKMEQ